MRKQHFIKTKYTIKIKEKICIKILFLFLLLTSGLLSNAYASDPVTVIVTLTPPYTPFLNEYGTIGVDKLMVTLIINDNRMINYPAKLQMYVEKVNSGVVMYTGSYASISPIFLTGGSTEILTGVDLAPYFLAGNNVFSGFDQAQYQFTGRIPDGQYRIGFQVVDAQRSDVILSNTVYTQPGWFVLNDVPQLNLPRNNSEERVNDIQNVVLEWFPRHLGSMNSSFPVSYQVELFAIRVQGMEPNQVVLSAVPDFTDVTNQNRYILSSDKYMLEPGVEYAWRVRAVTDQGLTLFVNNGYSEVFSFVYGSLCPEPLNPYSRVYGADKAMIGWDTDPLHSAYETRIRAKYATDPVWHSFKGYDNLVEISKILSPVTTYEYQVKAVCLMTESDYTEIDTFCTFAAVNENFTCGADDTANVTNKVPKITLKTGEYIFDGQFPVKLTTISGSNGVFTGIGRMRIPFLNNIQVNVKFASIKVNELNEVYEGELISIYNPNSKFYIDDLSDYWSVGDQVGNVVTGQDSAAIHLDYTVIDASVLNVVFNGNTVTVNGAATTITTSTGGTTISDSKGNLYSVDASGNTTQVGVSGGTDNTGDYAGNAAAYNNLYQEIQISFSDYESDLWAFDTWREEYTGKQLVENEYEDINGYKVPWKLIPAGKSGTVEVNLLKGVINLDSIVFKTPTGTEYFLKDGKLTIIGGKTGDVQEIYALYPKGDSLISIGKLKVATYEMLSRKMVLVPVGEQDVNLENISENLNKAWLPYGVEWEVTLDSAFTDMSWDENGDGQLEAGESGFFSMYSSEMKGLNKVYSEKRGTDEEILYVFVFSTEAKNSEDKQLLGDMPLSSQFGYIFKPSDDETSYKTIAHEVGHGFFQLGHTFNDDYGLADNDNMMDYSSGTNLFKQQWDAMFDPQEMILAWAQDDEEGEAQWVRLKYFFLTQDMHAVYLSEKGKRSYIHKHNGLKEYSDEFPYSGAKYGFGKVGIDTGECKLGNRYKLDIYIKNILVSQGIKADSFDIKKYNSKLSRGSNPFKIILSEDISKTATPNWEKVDTMEVKFMVYDPIYYLTFSDSVSKTLKFEENKCYPLNINSKNIISLYDKEKVDTKDSTQITSINWEITENGTTRKTNSDTIIIKAENVYKILIKAYFKYKFSSDTLSFNLAAKEVKPSVVSPIAFSIAGVSSADTMVYFDSKLNKGYIAVRNDGRSINARFERSKLADDFSLLTPVSSNKEKLSVSITNKEASGISVKIKAVSSVELVDSSYINLCDSSGTVRATQVVLILQPFKIKYDAWYPKKTENECYDPKTNIFLNSIFGSASRDEINIMTEDPDKNKNKIIDWIHGDLNVDEYGYFESLISPPKLSVYFMTQKISEYWKIDTLLKDRKNAKLVTYSKLDKSMLCDILDSNLKVLDSIVTLTKKDTCVLFDRKINKGASYIRSRSYIPGIVTKYNVVFVTSNRTSTAEVLAHELMHTCGLTDISNTSNNLMFYSTTNSLGVPCLTNEKVVECETGTGNSISGAKPYKQWVFVKRAKN